MNNDRIKVRDGIVYNNKRYYKLHGFNDYRINKDGEIIYLKTIIDDYGKTYIEELYEVKPFKKHKKLFVTLDNENYLLEKIVCNTFYGDIDLPIKHRYDELYCGIDNLYYHLSHNDIIYNDDKDEYCICDTLFRKCKLSKDKHRKKIYYISRNGIVYDSLNKKICKLSFTDQSYKMGPCGSIHRNVYASWVGDINESMTIDHTDTDVTNNDYTNLEQVTRGENNTRAYRNAMKPVSYSNDQVHHVCKMMENGKTKADICEYLNISLDDSKGRLRVSEFIFRLKRGEERYDIAKNYNFSKFDNSKYRYTVIPRSQIPEIMEYYFNHNQNGSATARYFGYNISTMKTVIQNNRDLYRDKYITQ